MRCNLCKELLLLLSCIHRQLLLSTLLCTSDLPDHHSIFHHTASMHLPSPCPSLLQSQVQVLPSHWPPPPSVPVFAAPVRSDRYPKRGPARQQTRHWGLCCAFPPPSSSQPTDMYLPRCAWGTGTGTGSQGQGRLFMIYRTDTAASSVLLD